MYVEYIVVVAAMKDDKSIRDGCIQVALKMFVMPPSKILI